jgi:hypothetical protein
MASKKKRGGKPRAKARVKAKAGTKKKAKAGPKKKAKAGAKKAKRAPARKRAAVKVAKVAKPRPPKATKPATEISFPLIIDEVLEEPLVDVSTILRVKDGVARSQRDLDEDERKQFSDPSIVVEAQKRDARRAEDDTDESLTHLPELFASEVRAQKARVAESPAPKRHDGSLFGSLGSDPSDDEPEED